MCLAVPMRVLETEGAEGDISTPAKAFVEAGGVCKEVRLDIVDRWPGKGDYVIVHAGFAIHALTAEEAEESLRLLRRMAESLE
ncbi:MAG: HypC/HybG/HupF family hydrogenase formation chaperone [Thermodesulfobacteriota bacterium]